jgi:hypothetical protein
VEPASDIPLAVSAIHAAIHKGLQYQYMIGARTLAPRENLLSSLRLCMNAQDYKAVECFLRGVGSDEAARYGQLIHGRLLFALDHRYADHLGRATSPWPTYTPKNEELRGVPIANQTHYDSQGNAYLVHEPLYGTSEPPYKDDEEVDRKVALFLATAPTAPVDPAELLNRWFRRLRGRRAARVRNQQSHPGDSMIGGPDDPEGKR